MTALLKISQGVRAFDHAGLLLLLSEPDNRLHIYNRTAAAIWRMAADGDTPQAIADTLSVAYDIPLSTARSDIDRQIGDWRLAGVIGTSAESSRENSDILFSVVDEPRTLQAYRIGDKVVRIGAADEDIGASLHAQFRAFATDASDTQSCIELTHIKGDAPYALRVNGVFHKPVETAAEAVGAVMQAMMQSVIGPVELMAVIHGAAVATPEGQSVLLPAAGGSGKSTLAAYLSRRGYGFLSDDMIALRAGDGHVLPWPAPHSLKSGSWEPLAAVMPEISMTPVERINGRAIKFAPSALVDWGGPDTPPGIIVFPKFTPDASPRVDAVAPDEALLRLVEDRLWLGCPMTGERVSSFLGLLAGLKAFSITYGRLEQAEDMIAACLDQR